MNWIRKGLKIVEETAKKLVVRQPQVFYHRLPCKFCGEHDYDHVEGKCLFSPTRYKAPKMGPRADDEFRRQAEEKFDPRRTDELHVFFEETYPDVGVTYYLVSNQAGEGSLRSPSNYSFDLEWWPELCEEWAS